jgi:hypothetical protein
VIAQDRNVGATERKHSAMISDSYMGKDEVSQKRPWSSGPMEILLHGISLLEHDTDTNRRLAMLSIDNSVELMLKTFLGLPQRVTGIRLGRKDLEEIGESFPRLLDAIHQHAPEKVRDYDISEIEWFHRLRNELYHQGNGLTVERQKVAAYAGIAKGLFRQLFGHDPFPVPDRVRELQDPPAASAVTEAWRHPPDSTKGWFLIHTGGRKYFAATANARGSCSLRMFDSDSGQFLRKQYGRGDYQHVFRDVLASAKRLYLRHQPNLERDCRPRLPADVLQELRHQSGF